MAYTASFYYGQRVDTRYGLGVIEPIPNTYQQSYSPIEYYNVRLDSGALIQEHVSRINGDVYRGGSYSGSYQGNYYQSPYQTYSGCAQTSVPPSEVRKEKNNVEKIYRAIKDTPWFSAGAILSNKDSTSSYKPVDDIWNSDETPELKKYLNDNGISLASTLIENTPTWFERVYSVKSIKGMYYVGKEAMKNMLSKGVVDDGKDEETK